MFSSEIAWISFFPAQTFYSLCSLLELWAAGTVNTACLPNRSTFEIGSSRWSFCT